MFSLSRYCQAVFKMTVPFYTPSSNAGEFHLLTVLPTLSFVHLIKTLVFWQVCHGILLWFEFVLSWWLIMLNTLHVVIGPLSVFFHGVPAQVSLYIFKLSYFSFPCWFRGILYILQMSSFCWTYILHLSSSVNDLPFHSLTGAFWRI